MVCVGFVCWVGNAATNNRRDAPASLRAEKVGRRDDEYFRMLRIVKVLKYREHFGSFLRPAKAGVFSRDQTCRGKSQSHVARMAGWRETETLKPIGEVSLGEITSHRAVMRVNAKWPRKQMNPSQAPSVKYLASKSPPLGTRRPLGSRSQHRRGESIRSSCGQF